MDWKTVAEKIIQDDQNKWDRKVAGQDLRISGDGALELVNGGGANHTYSLSDLATTEMCQRLDIPVKYFRRLSNEMKAKVGNYDLRQQDGKSFLLRGKGDWIRAFLSSDLLRTTTPRSRRRWKACSARALSQ
jgi:hypothetical protein